MWARTTKSKRENNYTLNIFIRKPASSGELFVEITSFVLAEGDLPPPQTKWSPHKLHQTKVFSFHILIKWYFVIFISSQMWIQPWYLPNRIPPPLFVSWCPLYAHEHTKLCFHYPWLANERRVITARSQSKIVPHRGDPLQYIN